MRADYIDDTGKVVAWTENKQLFSADASLVGNIDISGDVICPNTGDVLLFMFHEGIYRGPNQPPIAWLQDSEFKK